MLVFVCGLPTNFRYSRSTENTYPNWRPYCNERPNGRRCGGGSTAATAQNSKIVHSRKLLLINGYRHEPPPGSLLRKKLVRRFMGRASCLRICSMRLRSLSFFRAFSFIFLFSFFFIQCFFQDLNYCQVPRSAKSFFAPNNFFEAGNF